MTLQGLRVRDALGTGEGSTIPSRFPGSCKGRGLWLQVTPQKDCGWGLPDAEGAPDVDGSGKGAGLEEGSPRGWGHRPAFRVARGPSPKMRLGGPPGSLGRASLSGPFSPGPQGGPQSRPGRHMGGGRGGASALPAGGQDKCPQTPPGAGGERGRRVWWVRALRPQVTRARGVPVREPE